MDEFADSLYRERVSSWSEQYIDYEELQSKVDAAAEPNQDEATCQQRKTEVESMLGSHDVVPRPHLLALCLKRFLCAAALDKEIKKVLSFYDSQLAQTDQGLKTLHKSFDTLKRQMSEHQTAGAANMQLADNHLQMLQQTGKHVTDLLQVRPIQLASQVCPSKHALLLNTGHKSLSVLRCST